MITPYCELRDGAFWGEDTTNNPIHVKHDHVMQFTGLKDKNGKEIYEGDLLRTTGIEHIHKIVWAERFASWCITRSDWAFAHYFGEAFEGTDCEVIGNVYENPELLKP